MLARGAAAVATEESGVHRALAPRLRGDKLAVALKKVVVLLLGKGARVDVQDKDGATALMWASANGHEKW